VGFKLKHSYILFLAPLPVLFHFLTGKLRRVIEIKLYLLLYNLESIYRASTGLPTAGNKHFTKNYKLTTNTSSKIIYSDTHKKKLWRVCTSNS